MGGLGAGLVSRSPRLPPDLAMMVNSYMKEQGPLKIQCLLSDKDFSSAVAGEGRVAAKEGRVAAKEGRVAAKVKVASKSQHGPFTHCRYSVTGEVGSGTLHSLQRGGEVLLFSCERGRFFDSVMRTVGRLRPGVIAPFTESAKIKSILAEYEESAGASLKHKKSVRKRTVGAMPKTSLEWDRAAENRKYETVGDAFADAKKKDLVIDSLRAFAGKDGGLDITVSRGGRITVHSGSIEDVYDNILRPIADNGTRRRSTFSHRSRSERPDREPKPLLVKYGRDVFADDGAMKRFCELIDRYPHCNYVIVHAGNSHFYISIVDRTDNSSVAVRSVGGDALAIIPQIRTTEASLLRLTGFLASAFYEGSIGEYKW